MNDENMLNKKIEFMSRAHSKLNPLASQSASLIIGDNEVEFCSEKSPGYVQIAWSSIVQIRVQMFFKGRYVRGFFIGTDENQDFEFIVSNAKEVLRKMRNHLGREQFVRNPSNLSQIFHRKKNS